jgi:hypothetical protein
MNSEGMSGILRRPAVSLWALGILLVATAGGTWTAAVTYIETRNEIRELRREINGPFSFHRDDAWQLMQDAAQRNPEWVPPDPYALPGYRRRFESAQ